MEISNSIHILSLEKWDSRLFRLDDDIEKILSGFSHDALVSEAIREYPGLRLLRQEPHQCMFSFVCANNTSITMIRRMLTNLSRKFGSKVIYDGKEFFTFPTANTLHRATLSEICTCGLGYRSTSIKALAKSLVREELDVKHLMRLSYEHAKEHLMEIHGIGNKIADCILLFSLEKLEAFPIDIWITELFSITTDGSIKTKTMKLYDITAIRSLQSNTRRFQRLLENILENMPVTRNSFCFIICEKK